MTWTRSRVPPFTFSHYSTKLASWTCPPILYYCLLSSPLPFLSLPFLLLSPLMGAEAMGWQDRYNPIIFTSDPPDRGLCTQASRQIALVKRLLARGTEDYVHGRPSPNDHKRSSDPTHIRKSGTLEQLLVEGQYFRHGPLLPLYSHSIDREPLMADSLQDKLSNQLNIAISFPPPLSFLSSPRLFSLLLSSPPSKLY